MFAFLGMTLVIYTYLSLLEDLDKYYQSIGEG